MAGTKPISSLLVKPAGPDCNLACEYCFYARKWKLYPHKKKHRMDRNVAEEMIKQYMAMYPHHCTFAWQGGEPTMMGLQFFRMVTALQMKHGRPGQVVANGLQTNGTLIDDEWARFLRRYNFLVGISIDGPHEIHDKWRVYRDGRPTLDNVLRGLKALQQNGVETNALTMVTSHSWDKPQMIWDFLRDHDIEFFQFIPCLERDPETGEKSKYSVEPEQYGEFMCHMFDLWSEPECPETYVRLFNDLVQMYAGGEGPSCINKERCGEYVVIEHNGDVYACDFFVDKDHYIGNLLKTPLKDLVHSEKMEQFALAKGDAGPECEECPWWDICYGGCPKDRVYATGRTDNPSYLCEGYRMLFEHADSRLRELAEHYLEEQEEMADGRCML